MFTFFYLLFFGLAVAIIFGFVSSFVGEWEQKKKKRNKIKIIKILSYKLDKNQPNKKIIINSRQENSKCEKQNRKVDLNSFDNNIFRSCFHTPERAANQKRKQTGKMCSILFKPNIIWNIYTECWVSTIRLSKKKKKIQQMAIAH